MNVILDHLKNRRQGFHGYEYDLCLSIRNVVFVLLKSVIGVSSWLSLIFNFASLHSLE